MTVRPIRRMGEPVLRRACRPVTDLDAATQLVNDLTETCRLPGRAGLAAPQIGVALRAFCYLVDGVEGYVLNPTLMHVEGRQGGPEGCLSIPDLDQLPTPRAWRAVVAGGLPSGTAGE